MKRSLNGLWLILVTAFLLAGCARTSLSTVETSGKDFGWWGKSGAQPSPVKDVSRGGKWWWPKTPPKGKEDTAWGNRGYVYLKTPLDKPVTKKEKPAGKKGSSTLIQSREELEFQEVFFNFDSAKLTRKAQESIRKNVEVLKTNPALKITLEGYASPEGSAAYNLRLSEKRANSVKDYLIKKEGINADRVTIKPCGELVAESGSYWRSRKVRFVRFIISK